MEILTKERMEKLSKAMKQDKDVNVTLHVGTPEVAKGRIGDECSFSIVSSNSISEGCNVAISGKRKVIIGAIAQLIVVVVVKTQENVLEYMAEISKAVFGSMGRGK